MNKSAYKKNIKNFSILIGYLKIAMEFDSFSDVRNEYDEIVNIIIGWAKDYSMNNNFDTITYDESLRLHTLIDNIKEKKLFDKNIGDEKQIADEILIWYEVVMKNINDERGVVYGKR